MKINKITLRNDLILIVSLLLVAIISLVLVFSSRSKDSTIAKVYVQDEVVLTVDLARKEEKTYDVYGINGKLVVETKNGSIRVKESNCPHQDCVKTGFVNTSNHPIICAYNATYIIIEGTVTYDVEI